MKRGIAVVLWLVITVATVAGFTTDGQASSANVAFSVSDAGITGTLSTDVDAADMTAKPGEVATVTFTANQGLASLEFDLGTLGQPTLEFETPIGAVAVPVVGVTGADVTADFVGSLTGAVTKQGPGTLNGASLSWSDWGSASVTVDTTGTKHGDRIVVSLALEYTFSIGVTLRTFLGDVELIPPTPFAGVEGSQMVTQTIEISDPIAALMPVLIGVPIAAVAAGAGYWAIRKKKSGPRTQTPPGQGVPPARPPPLGGP